MISTIQNISHTQNTIQNNCSSAPLVSFSQNKSSVHFGGFIHKIQKTTDSNEIKELIQIFQNSLEMNIEGKISKPSRFFIIRKFENFMKKLSSLPFEFTAKQSDAITKIIKDGNNKIIGGFSTITDTLQSNLYIGLLTVAPEYKNAKNLPTLLKTMGKEIESIAENLNLKKVSWTVNDKNRPVLNLLKRFKNTNKTYLNASEKIYTVDLQDFRTTIENI